jgi:predicted RNA-binding Zn-ribbon protein involved in translation (DUF1610 family)
MDMKGKKMTQYDTIRRIIDRNKVVLPLEGEMLCGWRNVTDRDNAPCPACGSWIDHWKKFTKVEQGKNVICRFKDCRKHAKHGAHVYNPEISGVWIVPLCGEDNHHTKTNPFDLKLFTTVVSADISLTKCKKKRFKLAKPKN